MDLDLYQFHYKYETYISTWITLLWTTEYKIIEESLHPWVKVGEGESGR